MLKSITRLDHIQQIQKQSRHRQVRIHKKAVEKDHNFLDRETKGQAEFHMNGPTL